MVKCLNIGKILVNRYIGRSLFITQTSNLFIVYFVIGLVYPKINVEITPTL